MSSQPPRQVPAAWVHELFRRFTALYGAQRCASLYDAGEFETTVQAWCGALAKFDPTVVKAALEALPGADRSWPPSLAEFVTMCRQCVPAPEHRRALPVPSRTPDEIRRGREQMDRIRAMIGGALRKRDAAVTPREPGSDDEPVPAIEPIRTPACTCWVGLKRSEVPCRTCVAQPVASMVRG